LISSLRATGEAALVFVVAFDETAYEYLDSRKSELGLIVRKSDDLLTRFPELAGVVDNRKYSEFFFTSSPFMLKLALEEVDEGDVVVYLDADLFFFENPQAVFDELADGSIGIIRHNYPNNRKRLAAKYGTFNVGLVAFRNDAEGRSVLDWWAARCIEWCHDFPMDGKYADQGYLDHFPELSSKTVILENPGFNLAPWNTSSSTLSSVQQKVVVNSKPLLFFHFHGLSRVGKRVVTAQLTYRSLLNKSVFQSIYGPYVAALTDLEQQLKDQGVIPNQPAKRGVGLRGFVFAVYKKALNLLSIALGQSVLIRKSR
jgi:hypothetical protein